MLENDTITIPYWFMMEILTLEKKLENFHSSDENVLGILDKLKENLNCLVFSLKDGFTEEKTEELTDIIIITTKLDQCVKSNRNLDEIYDLMDVERVR